MEFSPLVSVIMSVYNAEDYIQEAVSSILNQTYPHFEFLIIDDFSTDGTKAILDVLKDERIVLSYNSENKGYTENLNSLIKRSRGKYIARMDADDISISTRFQKQVEFMEANPEYGLCGTWIELFGQKVRIIRYPVNHNDIRIKLLFDNAFAHPSVMIRKSVLEEYELKYNQELEPAEDYRLWVQIAEKNQVCNIAEPLLKYRWHDNQVSQNRNQLQIGKHQETIRYQFKKIGMEEKQINILKQIVHNDYELSLTFITEAESSLSYFLKRIGATGYLDLTRTKHIIHEKWKNLTYGSSRLGLPFFLVFYSSPLTQWEVLSLGFRVKFFFKCLLKK